MLLRLWQTFLSGFRWQLSLWRLLFCFGVISINLRFITGNNLSSTSSLISDHYQVILCDFEGKIFLLCREKFCNGFRTHGFPRSLRTSGTRLSSSTAIRTSSIWSGVAVVEGWSEWEWLSIDELPFVNHLYHTLNCVLPIYPKSKLHHFNSLGATFFKFEVVDNCGIQVRREELLFILVPHRGNFNFLARK